MSVLSNTEIVKALDDGRLVIDPRPHPGPGAENSPYDTVSVDLQLADEIYVPDSEIGNIVFDIKEQEQRSLKKTIKAIYGDPKRISPSGFRLEPSQFILGRTLEEVHLPYAAKPKCLSARIEGRSSYARLGLIVHFTAPTIHAGFQGVIALEIINLGPHPIMLRPGIRICQLIVETVEGVPVEAKSQFHGQQEPAG